MAKRIKYRTLTPAKAGFQPEFYDEALYFSWLMREPGKWLQTNLNKGTVHIKEIDKDIVLDEEGVVKLPLKTGTYHAKIVDFGDTDMAAQFEWWKWLEDENKEAAMKRFLRHQKYREFVVNNEHYLYSGGTRRTKLVAEDIPNNYASGWLYGQNNSFINCEGVKEVLFHKSPITEESIKDDALYISYDKIISKSKENLVRYEGYDEIVFGWTIEAVLKKLSQYSPDCKGLAEAKQQFADAVKEREDFRRSRGW